MNGNLWLIPHTYERINPPFGYNPHNTSKMAKNPHKKPMTKFENVTKSN
jgi:hypothetical protein